MNSDITSALIGFGGVVLGLTASAGTTWATQRIQKREALQDKRDAVGREAADAALVQLISLKNFLKKISYYPTAEQRDRLVEGMPGTEPEGIYDNRSPWTRYIDTQMDKLELHVLRIADDDVRTRVGIEIDMTRRGAQGDQPRVYFTVATLLEDVIEVLAAHRRYAAIPPPPDWYTREMSRREEEHQEILDAIREEEQG